MCSSVWKIHYKSGDLFRCPASDALAHCISEDCRMGAGIAVSFRNKFGGVQELLAQKKRPGQCAVLRRPERFVYYLITKEKYNHKPEYITLKRSLLDMRNHCLENGVHSISMPRIGCGLDKLNWGEVSLIITDVFKHTDVRITVYDLERRRVDAKGTSGQNRELLGKVGTYSQKAAH